MTGLHAILMTVALQQEVLEILWWRIHTTVPAWCCLLTLLLSKLSCAKLVMMVCVFPAGPAVVS